MSFWETIQPPVDISTNGHLITYLFNYTTILASLFFILVCVGLFGFSYLYSKKRHPKPYYTYGNKKPHLLITLIIGLSVFLILDVNITRMSNDDMRASFWKWPSNDDKILKVEVMAQQWAWNFRYAGADGEFNTADDIVTVNDLRIPVNTKILVHLISKDVIHSFYLPNFRMKVDAMPGRVSRVWFEATQTGKYEIACAEMCGISHYLMRAELTIYDQNDFNNWQSEAQKLALNTNDSTNLNSFWGWKWNN